VPADASPSFRVFADPNLLPHVTDLLGGGAAQSRTLLCGLRGMGRAWREHFSRDFYWRPVATALMPALGQGGSQLLWARGMSYHGYMLEQGRAAAGGTCWEPEVIVPGRLEMHVEVWDENDGFRIFSAVGPAEMVLDLHGVQGNAVVEFREVYINAREFTAASRGDYQDVHTYFGMNWEELDTTRSSPVRSRAVLRDRVTGKTVLLWRSGRYDKWELGIIDGDDSDLEEEEYVDGQFMASMDRRPPHWLGMCSEGSLSMYGLYVSPLKGQEGISDKRARTWCANLKVPYFVLNGADLIARLVKELQG
jgi:hypothetical protein